ncbi:rhodaneselike domain containing protein [Acanthamoeba castellanii str. Neff]|uniref:Rhodaneselike domain containing protein n=1 Tax=Acanthamoeba castellanii (strain ATCC 30010 / Neff) TaxID=1257118 RepID=L8H0M9_ACACF|nr:rhodaneselike domain containing protein [Acanthamoeba castellanii str. Neff]ELR18795.1 rhodaneselike domain containing protein [Acanthamoeba castellanii str. Neff]
MEGGVPKAKLQISIPKNFQRITAEDLASLLFKQRHSGVLVVDVRGPDFHGGHIPGALNLPFDDAVESKLEQLAKEHGRKDYIVFYCMYGQLRSPAAALSLIKALGTDAASQGNNVYVLAEGFKNWVKTFNGKKDDHIENFDRECWDEVESELVHINDQPSPRDLAGH